MNDIRTILFEPGRVPARVDVFLTESLPDLTRSQIRRLIDEGLVLSGGAAVKAGGKLKGGESLEVRIPAPVETEAVAEEIDLDILYEDAHLVVVNKPPGLVVHPAPGHQGGTLVNALLFHCADLSGIGGELRPGIVHRLDKDTSGVMVVTKNDAAHHHLAAQFKAHSISRRYVALVHGMVQNVTGTVDKPIGRHLTERKKMSGRTRAGRRAVTHWKVLRRFDLDRMSFLELSLETGRTHQIRVHFSEMNLPIVGDPVYGNASKANALTDLELRRRVHKLGRQALHARLLGFIHPVSGEYMEFESPLPPDFAEILDYLENKYQTDSDFSPEGN